MGVLLVATLLLILACSVFPGSGKPCHFFDNEGQKLNATPKSTNNGIIPGKCQLSSNSGRCSAYFTRFYFNSATYQCERFVYGGCGGNANKFITLEQCKQVCLPEEIAN